MDRSENTGKAIAKLRHSRPLEPKKPLIKQKPVNSNASSSNSSGPAFKREFNISRSGDNDRSSPEYFLSKSRESKQIHTSLKRENILAPSSKSSDNYLQSICSSTPLAPIPDSRAQKSNQAPISSRSRLLNSKTITPDIFVESSPCQTGNTFDTTSRNDSILYDHKQSHAAHREIFSPIPSQHVGDERLGGWNMPGSKRISGRNSDVVNSLSDGCLFPEIRVEDFDGSSSTRCSTSSSTRFFNSKDLISDIKRSPTVPKATSFDTFGSNRSYMKQKATSLDVPAPVVRWRTSEGRLIAAMNDSRISNNLSRSWSHSEGNIPLAMHYFDEQKSPDIRTIKKQSAHSSNCNFNRSVISNSFSLDPLLSPRSAASGNTYSVERHTLMPALQSDTINKPTIHQTQTTQLVNINKNLQFLSPQLQRKIKPNF